MAKFTLNVNGKTHDVGADPDMPLQWRLKKFVIKRAGRPALHEVAISRVDVWKDVPRIVRSRLTPKKP